MRQAIVTKFFGPTNSRGSRIKATCQAGSITVPWDFSLGSEGNHDAAAKALAVKLDWKGAWFSGGMPGNTGNCYVWSTDGFDETFRV